MPPFRAPYNCNRYLFSSILDSKEIEAPGRQLHEMETQQGEWILSAEKDKWTLWKPGTWVQWKQNQAEYLTTDLGQERETYEMDIN